MKEIIDWSELSEQVRKLLATDEYDEKQGGKLTEQPVSAQGEAIFSHYLRGFMEAMAAKLPREQWFGLRYASLDRLPLALSAFVREKAPGSAEIARTLACILYALAIQEHGCALRTVRAKGASPAWEGDLSLKLGKKREIDFLPAAEAALDAPLRMDSGIFLSMGRLIRDYRSAIGVDLAEKGITDVMIALDEGAPSAPEQDVKTVKPTTLEESIRLAPLGNRYAMTNLAIVYLNGLYGVRQDPGKARYWFERLAEAGDGEAMFNLGLIWARGFGVRRDMETAAEWMKKAAAAGDEDAPAMEALCRNVLALSEPAEKGDTDAQAELAHSFMQLGLIRNIGSPEPDFRNALRWAKRAAEGGSAKAMWLLGLAYEKGRGTAKNSAAAFRWYQRGAEKGYAPAQTNLGCMYGRGEGVKKDTEKANEWIRRGAEGGDKAAIEILKDLSGKGGA